MVVLVVRRGLRGPPQAACGGWRSDMVADLLL
jgi:hypothetical protein